MSYFQNKSFVIFEQKKLGKSILFDLYVSECVITDIIEFTGFHLNIHESDGNKSEKLDS